MMIEIWGKTNCAYCEQAKMLCEQNNIDYVYKLIDVDFTREAVLDEFPGAKTFPQIKVDGEAIGGHSELYDHFVKLNLKTGPKL